MAPTTAASFDKFQGTASYITSDSLRHAVNGIFPLQADLPLKGGSYRGVGTTATP